jgi:hypothetical protein
VTTTTTTFFTTYTTFFSGESASNVVVTSGAEAASSGGSEAGSAVVTSGGSAGGGTATVSGSAAAGGVAGAGTGTLRRSSDDLVAAYDVPTYGTRCGRNTLPDIFTGGDDSQMTFGNQGWTFPYLIWGECPVTAAMLKYPFEGQKGSYLNF